MRSTTKWIFAWLIVAAVGIVYLESGPITAKLLNGETLILSPLSGGRDYNSEKDVRRAWRDGFRFMINDGRAVNIEDAKVIGVPSVRIQYDRLRRTAVVPVK